MNTLYVMCGVPGSGKSTWLRNNVANEKCVISRDKIRFSYVSEDEEYFSKENFVYDKFIEAIVDSMKNNELTFADATHITKGSRKKLLKALTAEGIDLKEFKVKALVCNEPEAVALERNELRAGTRAYVPRGVIRRMSVQFEQPTTAEGFDEIIDLKERNFE